MKQIELFWSCPLIFTISSLNVDVILKVGMQVVKFEFVKNNTGLKNYNVNINKNLQALLNL